MLDKYGTSTVIQEKIRKTKPTEITNKYKPTNEEIQTHKEMIDSEKKLITDMNEIERNYKEIKKMDRQIKRLFDSLLGKSKVDLYFEKLVDTPRKRKLLKNRAIHVISKEYFDERKENITKDIVFYLKKFQMFQMKQVLMEK